MEENKTNEKELEMLSKHWKKIPIISTQIFVENLPYILSPWDHWNKVINKLKSDIQTKTIDTLESYNNDDSESVHVEVSSENTDEQIDDVSTGYHTEMSEGDFTSGEVSDVDWETDNDNF